MKLNCSINKALIFSIVCGMVACSQEESMIFPESDFNVVGLSSPIQLEPDSTAVPVQDFVLYPNLIDSIAFTGGGVKFTADREFFLFDSKAMEPINLLKIYSGDTIFSIPVQRSDKLEVEFKLSDPTRSFKTVQVFGDFNAWNPQLGAMEYIDGAWTRTDWLSPGRYQYLFAIDGVRKLDPANPDSVDNNFGGYNSLRWVANPVDDKPLLRTRSYSQTSIELSAVNTTRVIALWENQELNPSQIISDGERIKLIIPEAAKQTKRSFIRVYVANKYNVGNQILIPLEYGKVVSSANQLSRSDWRANILYFLMVDRFNNADSTNDGTMHDPEILPQADYYGGDIKGVTEKIRSGYFKELGINSVWLSPIVQNAEGAWGLFPKPRTKFSAYHGYWPTSFSKVDYRFGTPDDLKELVKTAHENNFNVLLDFIANHVHKNHWVYKQHPDWATDLYLPDGSLNTERWDEYRLTTWFDTHLPSLDLMNPELTNMLTDSAIFWIDEYDIDGFRHDATKHVPSYFWRELTKKIKKQIIYPKKKSFYQIGETYGSRELIASYVGSGQMDAQFDFGIYDDALPTFARDGVSFSRLKTSIDESAKYYGNHHLMGNITGNQDKSRFMGFAGGDLRFDEDQKLAGWTREIKVDRPEGYSRLKLFHAFNMTIPGIPVIYYGDEIGMTGGNDPDNRRMMRFDLSNPEEIDVKGTVSRLAKLRRQSLELSYGDLTWLSVSDDVMVFARTYFDQIAIVALNKGKEVADVQVKVPDNYKEAILKDLIGEVIENTDGYINLSVQPMSFQIIQNKE